MGRRERRKWRGGSGGEEVQGRKWRGGRGKGTYGSTFSGKKIGNQLIIPGLFVSIVSGFVLSSTPG